MKCRECGTAANVEARFCEECGAQLSRICSACFAEVNWTAKFCPACGTSLQDLPGEAPHPPSTAPLNLDAERRQLTVLFCDLVGSTALAERLDPEELRDLMQTYQRACGDVIARYDGHVAQYLGDGLMVYFGWPSAHEDDAVRAIRAGLEMTLVVSKLTASTPICARVV